MPSKKPPARRPRRPSVPTFTSVAVVVADRRKALQWYTEVLGLTAIDEMDHWVTVGTKGRAGVMHLCQTSEYDPKGTLEPGNTGVLLQLPGKDFPASCAALKERGVSFVSEPEKADWGWWASIRDPDGNEFTVMPA